MPITFLSKLERANYEVMPVIIDELVMVQNFHLVKEDLKFIEKYHGKLNGLGVGIQIGLIRYLGYLPHNWQIEANKELINFVAKELKQKQFKELDLSDYGKRDKTRTEHLQGILKYLGYRRWQPLIDEVIFEKWLIDRGMEHESERWLLEILCQKLHQEKIFRPSIQTLEGLVGRIEGLLNKESYQRLSFMWQKEMFDKLDKLLVIEENQTQNKHRWLCTVPNGNSAKMINETLDKVHFLKEMGVNNWDLSVIADNRKKRLANMARQNTNTYLQKLSPLKRYPILVCFLWESLLDTTDSVLTMYDDYWQHAVNGAKKALESHQLNAVKSQKQALQALTQTVQMVIDDSIENQKLREVIFKNLPKEQLQEALNALLGNTQVIYQSHLFFLKPYFPKMKLFTVNLLKILSFKVAFEKDNFDKALNWVIDLQTAKKRKLPPDAPTNFVSHSWEKLVINKGIIDQQCYELCVLSVLRDRLLSGDVFVEQSRKFTNFDSLLVPKETWTKEHQTICSQLGMTDLSLKIDKKVSELSELLPPLSNLLAQGTDIRMEDDVLIVSPLNAQEISSSAKALQEQINLRLPKVSLVDMIQEVDTWTNYSHELKSDMTSANLKKQAIKYAALFCSACNISLADLARSSDVNYHSLWWADNNYLSDENLKTANNILVNYHNKLWLTAHWGAGTLSRHSAPPSLTFE